MLEVSRRSPITGVISTMLLDITAKPNAVNQAS
jgi:hypothetical protein